MSFEINPVKQSELGELLATAKTTFLDAFAHLNTPEDIEIYTAKAFTKDQTIKEFETPGSSFYFIRVGAEIAGYLKINTGTAQTDTKLHNAVEIERIYIKDSFQGRKLGKALFQFSLELAQERNADWLWLGVWNQNHRAITFYEREGLETFAEHDFRLGNDLQTDILMKRAL